MYKIFGCILLALFVTLVELATRQFLCSDISKFTLFFQENKCLSQTGVFFQTKPENNPNFLILNCNVKKKSKLVLY